MHWGCAADNGVEVDQAWLTAVRYLNLVKEVFSRAPLIMAGAADLTSQTSQTS